MHGQTPNVLSTYRQVWAHGSRRCENTCIANLLFKKFHNTNTHTWPNTFFFHFCLQKIWAEWIVCVCNRRLQHHNLQTYGLSMDLSIDLFCFVKSSSNIDRTSCWTVNVNSFRLFIEYLWLEIGHKTVTECKRRDKLKFKMRRWQIKRLSRSHYPLIKRQCHSILLSSGLILAHA